MPRQTKREPTTTAPPPGEKTFIPAQEMIGFINPEHIQAILDKTFAVVMRDAVEAVVFEQSGWGKAGDFRDLIRAEASRLVREDPEINKKIRDGINGWIRRNIPDEKTDG